MKILRKWLLSWVQQAREECDEPVNMTFRGARKPRALSDGDSPRSLTFNVIPASGGVVISVRKYDRIAGEHAETLHVIHDDADVATNIGHIVSLELLRQ